MCAAAYELVSFHRRADAFENSRIATTCRMPAVMIFAHHAGKPFDARAERRPSPTPDAR
jgi:hypothetical protein